MSEPAAATGAMAPAPFVVGERVQETSDTWTLTLDAAAGPQLAVAPGQFVMVYVFGVGEVPISVSGAVERAAPLVLTVRSVGAVTRALCAAVPGSVLGVRGPFGNGWPPAPPGGDVVVLAGGIGLAPLRGVVLRALARRAEHGEVAVLYGARSPGDLLYRGELELWRESATVDVTVDAAGPGWSGKVGVVPQLVATAPFDPAAAAAYVCGPEIMMRFGIAALLDRGIAPERIHVSLERNMRCGVGLCGHCQLGPTLICRDGPVYDHATASPWLGVREL